VTAGRPIALPAHDPCGAGAFGLLDPETNIALCTTCQATAALCPACGLRAVWNEKPHTHRPAQVAAGGAS
jgi:hypothetical protein